MIKVTLGFLAARFAYTAFIMSSPALLLAAVPGLTRPLADWQVAAGYAVFAVSYFVFALGKLPGMKIDRPGMAIIGAVLMVAFRIVPAAEALRFIDFGTLVLLFSMMLVVGYLHLTGFFDWITEEIVTRLHPRHSRTCTTRQTISVTCPTCKTKLAATPATSG